MAIKLKTEAIRNMVSFEKITKVHPKDCIVTDNVVYFIVDPKKVGLAIGKKGSKIKKLKKILEKNVRVFGDAESAEEFIRGIVPDAKSVKKKGDVINVRIQHKDRSLIIGRNGQTIKAVRKILKRQYNVNDIKLKM